MPKRRTLDYPDATVPDEHRCRKSDGKTWRCPMRVMDRVGFCHHHYHQIRRNFDRRKALSASASSVPPAIPSLPRKRRRKGTNPANPQPDEAVDEEQEEEKRKILDVGEEKKKNRRDEEGDGEETRDLPNAVMMISPAEARARSGNAVSTVDWKLGFEDGLLWRRRFRSKNAEPVPIGPVKVPPFSLILS